MLQLANQVAELEVSALTFEQQSKKALRSKQECIAKMRKEQDAGNHEMAKVYASEAIALGNAAASSLTMSVRVRTAATRLETLLQTRLAAHSLAKISQTVGSIHGLTDTTSVEQAMKQFDSIMTSLETSAGVTSTGLAAKSASAADDAAIARLLEQGQAESDLHRAQVVFPSVPGSAAMAAEPPADSDLMRRYEEIMKKS